MADKNFPTMFQTIRDLRDATTSMSGFSPRQNAIKAASLDEKINTLHGYDTTINEKENVLRGFQTERNILVDGKEEEDGKDGLVRLTRQIIKYVDGLGDEYDSDVDTLKKILAKMAPSSTRRKPVDDKDKTRSTSEQSFESMVKHAEKVYDTIKTIPDYAPADEKITLAKFKTDVDRLSELNSLIHNMENKELKPLRKKRLTEYTSQTSGVAKILQETKKYVAGNYGLRSDEYSQIKHLKA
ncbi:MAG: hypothetical protein HY960_03005 [Ignavibacteriae bacterium]|nr:hypothetical protein [Ignavibacteriota bacterium]